MRTFHRVLRAMIGVIRTQLEKRIISHENLVRVELLPIAVLFAGDLVCLVYRQEGGIYTSFNHHNKIYMMNSTILIICFFGYLHFFK